MKRRKNKGFTLIEMMFVVGFFFLITGFLVNALVETTRIENIGGAQADMQKETHHGLDQIVHDIQDSQLVLSTYTNAGTTYTSNGSKTMVLQAPSFDASGNALGTNDYIVYYLSSGSAPYTLYQLVVPASGSARPAVKNLAIANNVQSLALTYYADDKVTGDGITTTFSTSGVPSSTPSVVKNGATLSSSQYTFTSPQTVKFSAAPAAPDAVDMIYPVSAATSPSQVSSIDVDLHLQQTSTAFQDAAKTQSVEIDSRADLRNH